jgi:hypothetical protein
MIQNWEDVWREARFAPAAWRGTLYDPGNNQIAVGKRSI